MDRSHLAARFGAAGKKLVHHEIIGVLADKMRLRKSHVVRFLEGKAGIWERMTTDRTSLSIYTADETLRLVESGDVAVLRGWGAAHLLRPIGHVVRVRVCAPFETRVERMMRRLDKPTTGRSSIRDPPPRSARRDHRRHFSLDWASPKTYDLVLNTERMRSSAASKDRLANGGPSLQETPESTRALADLALSLTCARRCRAVPRTSKRT